VVVGLELLRERQDDEVPSALVQRPSLHELLGRSAHLAKLRCSFCEKHRHHVRMLMSGREVYICDG
jgi:hypothetical protein